MDQSVRTMPLAKYFLTPYGDVERALLTLASLNDKEYFDVRSPASPWSLIAVIAAEMKNKELDHPDWPSKQAIMNLIDVSLLRSLYESYKTLVVEPDETDIQGGSVGKTNSVASVQVTNDSELEALLDSLVAVGCDTVYAAQMVEKLKTRNLSQRISEMKKATEAITRVMDDTLPQLRGVCAYLRALPDMTFLEYKKINSILGGHEKEFNPLFILSSLRDYLNDPDGKEIGLYAAEEVFPFSLESYSWYSAAIETILLHITYRWLYNMPDELQAIVLELTPYSAVVCGVPLKAGLSELLYPTQSVAEYLTECNRLLEAYEQNHEEVVLDVTFAKKKSFLEICKAYVNEAGDRIAKGQALSVFVEKMVGKQNVSQPIGMWIRDSVDIYAKLHETILIDHNIAGEETDEFLFKKDLVQLVEWFAAHATWNKIASYYKQKDVLVPIESFYRSYADAVDLSDEIAAQKFLALHSFLYEQGVKVGEDEPIVFDEKKGAFQWNESFMS